MGGIIHATGKQLTTRTTRTKMKTFNSIMRWIFLNGIIGTAIYVVSFTPLKENHNLVNITIFILWATAILAWVFLPFAMLAAIVAEPEDKSKWPEKLRTVPAWISHSFDMAVVFICAWNGWFWTAAIYFTHIFAQSFTIALLEHAAEKQRKTN